MSFPVAKCDECHRIDALCVPFPLCKHRVCHACNPDGYTFCPLCQPETDGDDVFQVVELDDVPPASIPQSDHTPTASLAPPVTNVAPTPTRSAPPVAHLLPPAVPTTTSHENTFDLTVVQALIDAHPQVCQDEFLRELRDEWKDAEIIFSTYNRANTTRFMYCVQCLSRRDHENPHGTLVDPLLSLLHDKCTFMVCDTIRQYCYLGGKNYACVIKCGGRMYMLCSTGKKPFIRTAHRSSQ